MDISIRSLLPVRITVIMALLLFTACGGKGNLSNGEAAKIIEQQVLGELTNIGIPFGSVVFMNGFEASLSGEDLKNKKYHPRRLQVAKRLAGLGLLTVNDRSSAFDFLTLKYDIRLTTKGEKQIVRKNSGMVYFDFGSSKVGRVVSNELIGDKSSDNPEPRRLVMAEFSTKQTELGDEVFGRPVDEKSASGRVRAILKYDSFDKNWKVERYDIGDSEGNWMSHNVDM